MAEHHRERQPGKHIDGFRVHEGRRQVMQPIHIHLRSGHHTFDAHFEAEYFQLAGNHIAGRGIKGDHILELAGHPAAQQCGIGCHHRFRLINILSDRIVTAWADEPMMARMHATAKYFCNFIVSPSSDYSSPR